MEQNKCLTCGSPTKPRTDNAKLGYSKYCSDKCRADAKKLKIDPDWIRTQRTVYMRSWESIAQELGCSPTPLRKRAAEWGIPKLQFNKSNAMVLAKLEDKQWLLAEHQEKHKTCEQIATELGISKSTVSVYLEKHGIEANPSNSYPRKHIHTSKPQAEIVEFIKSIYSGKVEVNDRTVLNGSELDIYMPEAKLAIEFNGVWHHLHRPNETTEARKKGKTYHLKKTVGCERKGIQLLHIWSSHWAEKKDVWKSRIAALLGVSRRRIYARKCEVREVEASTCRAFLDHSHLQGADRGSSLRLGLWFQGDLVAVMTFCKPRFNRKVPWELSRFACARNTSVVGGFSKLLSHFMEGHEGDIISYADRMYSDGSVYEKNGFRLIATNAPAYWYVAPNSEKLLHRYQFRKQFLKGANGRTEAETMTDLGYSVVWDCGTLTYLISGRQHRRA